MKVFSTALRIGIHLLDLPCETFLNGLEISKGWVPKFGVLKLLSYLVYCTSVKFCNLKFQVFKRSSFRDCPKSTFNTVNSNSLVYIVEIDQYISFSKFGLYLHEV